MTVNELTHILIRLQCQYPGIDTAEIIINGSGLFKTEYNRINRKLNVTSGETK